MSASDIVYVVRHTPTKRRHTPAKPDILLLSGLFIQTFCVQKAAAGQKRSIRMNKPRTTMSAGMPKSNGTHEI